MMWLMLRASLVAAPRIHKKSLGLKQRLGQFLLCTALVLKILWFIGFLLDGLSSLLTLISVAETSIVNSVHEQ